ncbi:hypothetical protein [Bifidobacterium longum]|uniref:hypothetical protein n=1 Tax=Bifidobacterium longum TaxID=216816 RepID=UPI001A90057B|nr:hypothetical protein [Bifidobacterium longum]GHM77301.1 hypothetical protein MCC00328_17140 [Bifidobacterium longum subsp. longum]
MMARYYYAYHWTYGIGTTWEDGSWPGSLMVFDSMGERDKWVADDVFDGDWHREAITAKEARRIMADTVIGFDNDMAVRYDGSRSAVERYASTVELGRAWRRVDMQNNPARYYAE